LYLMTSLFIRSEDALTARLEAGIAMVREAGQLARQAFAAMTPEQIGYKGPQDFLTATDLAVERLLRESIARQFPDDALLGEEQGGRIGDHTWVMDPIDGTANFARGIPHFCVVLAFVSQRQTQFGIIYDPIHDELFVARQGQGATRNGVPIRVASTADFSVANLELGWNARRPTPLYLQTLTELLALGSNVRRSACGALALAYVACGRTDGYIELHMNPWDCLAGLLLVREAGGIANEFTTEADWQLGGPVLAAVPPFVAAMAAAAGFPGEPSKLIRKVV
jgi:myo-inositol-1(or 4)-monophosphatase